MQTYAVLTGDIVASSDMDADALDAVLKTLHDAAVATSAWSDPPPVIGFARRGGDGWQLVTSDRTRSLRLALYLLASLTTAHPDSETRIAIAEGAGSLPPDNDPNFGHGPAFTASGRALESMDRYARLTHADGGAKAAAYRLADEIAQGWTQAQARAMAEVLPPGAGPRAEAAERLGITRSAVNQALWSAGYRALSDAMEFLETEARR